MISKTLPLTLCAAALTLGGAASAHGQLVSRRYTGSYRVPTVPLVPVATLEGNGTLRVHGTSGSDAVTVSGPSRSLLYTVTRGRNSASFNFLAVTRIVFDGGDGDDRFRNLTARPCELRGGAGNDELEGGAGDDFIEGGYGQDTLRGGGGDDVLWGSGGSDTLYGDAGDDRLMGHGGNDLMYGGSGRDRLYPGSGSDVVYGGSGMDDIIAVGGDADTLVGGSQWDNFWADPVDAISDASSNELARGYVKIVSGYVPLKTNAGYVSVPVGLTGPDLPDPVAAPGDLVAYADFSDQPLFPSAGISHDDVDQNALGDCYLLARLAAFAGQDPELVHKMVTDLGDGTYAVRFFSAGIPVYVRVDGDLPIQWNSNGPLYAGLGAEGAVWSAIIEKAFAVFRTLDNDYGTIEGGNGGTPIDIPLGGTRTGASFTGGLTKAMVRMWDDAGRPASSSIATTIDTQVDLLLEWIDDRLGEGRPVVTGALGSVSDATQLAPDAWRRGQHIFMVHSVGRDMFGNPSSLVLYDQRNPNTLVTLTDRAVIFYAVGRAYYHLPN